MLFKLFGPHNLIRGISFGLGHREKAEIPRVPGTQIWEPLALCTKQQCSKDRWLQMPSRNAAHGGFHDNNLWRYGAPRLLSETSVLRSFRKTKQFGQVWAIVF